MEATGESAIGSARRHQIRLAALKRFLPVSTLIDEPAARSGGVCFGMPPGIFAAHLLLAGEPAGRAEQGLNLYRPAKAGISSDLTRQWNWALSSREPEKEPCAPTTWSNLRVLHSRPPSLPDKPARHFLESDAALDAALGDGLRRLTVGLGFLFQVCQPLV